MRRFLLRSRKLYDFGKCLWMVDGKVCKHFPVDTDLLFIESGYQTRIGDVVQPCSSIDTGDPQRAKLALLCPTMAVRVRPGLVDVMFRNGVDLAAGTPVSFGRG